MFTTVPTLSHKNPVHALPSYLFNINFNISLSSMLGLRDFWFFQRRCFRHNDAVFLVQCYSTFWRVIELSSSGSSSLLRGLFPEDLHAKILYALLFFGHMYHMHHPPHSHSYICVVYLFNWRIVVVVVFLWFSFFIR